jgi:hypothetical protein
MALLFLPSGIYTLYHGMKIKEAPHFLAMMIFSGSLMVLLGLAGIIGLITPDRPKKPDNLK